MNFKAPNIDHIITLIIFLSLSFLVSCVEEYWPELKEQDSSVLVVEGRITNLPGPYQIQLSTSSSFDEPLISPITGAIVQIVDNQDNSEILFEIQEGIYTTTETGIQGIIGRSYKILINTIDGESYESAFEELLAPIEIESVTVQEKVRFAEDFVEDNEIGFQFYVTPETSTADNKYYSWELEETFEYRSEWQIVHIYNGYHQGFENGTDDWRWPSTPDTVFYCWKTDIIKGNFTQNTALLDNSKINNFPLYFIPFNTEKMKFKYSVLVKQLRISEEAHTYLNSLIEQNENQDGLYSSLPYQIRGNVFNSTNPDNSVLGYFMVAGISQDKRLTVVSPPNYEKWLSTCTEIEDGSRMGGLEIQRLYGFKEEVLPLFVTEIYFEDENGDFTKYMILPPQECIDCTLKGGVTKKPTYWDQ